MLFIETPIFTEDVSTLLTDEEYGLFQLFLAMSPESGDVIPHTGGLRKVRWLAKNKGKRGGKWISNCSRDCQKAWRR